MAIESSRKFENHVLTIGGMSVTLLLSPGEKPESFALIGKIEVGKRVVFHYVKDNYASKTAVRLYEHGNVSYAITVAGNALLDVYRIADMANWKIVALNSKPVFEGRKIEDTVYDKHVVGQRLDLKPDYSPNEKKVLAHLEARWAKEEQEKRIQREAEEAERKLQAQAAHEAAQKKRQEEVSRIMSRPILRGFSEDGSPLRGVPIVGEEWLKLRDGTHCVGVVSYDDGQKVSGEPVEYFVVSKKGHARKAQIRKFSMKIGGTKGAQLLESQLISIGGALQEINIYSPESLDPLLASGLNGGTLIGVPVGDSIQLYRFSGKSCKEEGQPILRAALAA